MPRRQLGRLGAVHSRQAVRAVEQHDEQQSPNLHDWSTLPLGTERLTSILSNTDAKTKEAKRTSRQTGEDPLCCWIMQRIRRRSFDWCARFSRLSGLGSDDWGAGGRCGSGTRRDRLVFLVSGCSGRKRLCVSQRRRVKRKYCKKLPREENSLRGERVLAVHQLPSFLLPKWICIPKTF